MNSTVEKFNQKIEELKKRLKAISTSQNILSKLNALEDYFKQIQDYLNSINTSFSDHITQSEDYSENIATLQSQIADVQQQIQNLPDLEDLNLTQMQADISTLKNDLSTLKGSSNSSISNLETQIATIQADISTITAQISTLQSNISKNSSDISTLKTTTQNHSTTLTNLTSSQNTLSSTVSNINNRLTSAESELSAITGGVDLTELNERVAELETMAGPTLAHMEMIGKNLNTYNGLWYSDSYHFSCKAKTTILVQGRIKYTLPTPNKNMSFFVEINGTKVFLSEIDTTTCLNEYKFQFYYNPSYNKNILKIYFYQNVGMTINDLEVTIFGANAKNSEITKEITAFCFNGYTYITRQYNDYIKYGKFLPNEDIDLDNLPNEQSLILGEYHYHRLYYFPFTRGVVGDDGNYYLPFVSDVLYGENNMNGCVCTKLDENDTNNLGSFVNHIMNNNTIPITGFSKYVNRLAIQDDRPGNLSLINATSFGYANIKLGSNYIYISPAITNNRMVGDLALNVNELCYVCKDTQGYINILKGFSLYCSKSKICKGDYATAYVQENNSINIYIAKNGNVELYNAIHNSETSDFSLNYIKTIEDCDYIIEILGDKLIKFSNNSWILESKK